MCAQSFLVCARLVRTGAQRLRGNVVRRPILNDVHLNSCIAYSIAYMINLHDNMQALCFLVTALRTTL